VRAAEEAGLDGIVLGIPPYVRPNDDEIVAFYERASSASALPLCVYNWPRGNGVDFSIGLLERLAEIDTVVAVKNSTVDARAFIDAFFALRNRLRMFGFGGDDEAIRLIGDEGGVGTIGGGGVLGREQPGFYEAIWRGDLDEARRLGARDAGFNAFSMTPSFDPTFASCPAIYKAALDAQGLPGGDPRPPLLPLTPDERERTYAVVEGLGLSAAGARSAR
jgi:4-hydroxy-tetrahydrodipicolinate synthase